MNGPSWINDTVFYQIFPERFYNGDPSNDPPNAADWAKDAPTRENFFGGDLEGIRLKIPHLQTLGVNALYLTPIFEAGSSHKYDTHDYLKIDPAFGTLDTFHALLSGLHEHGIRLVLDAVFNHCGDGFWAFRDVMQRGAQSKYANWFLIDSYPIRVDPPSYMTCGGAPFLPKLNTENPEVQQYLQEVTDYWLDQGIDGWRLDVPWKASPALWRGLRERVQQRWPEAYLVAETWRGTSEWLRGDTVHGVMNYRLRNLMLDYAALDHMDAEDFDYELHLLESEHRPTLPYHLTLLGSHDTPRIRTLCRGNIGRTIIAITLQMTYFGTPMVYYGDEIGMEGENDPDCRRPMIWNEADWNEPIYEATKRLITLRKSHAALRGGIFRTLRTFNGAYAYARVEGDDRVVVVLNPRGALPAFTVPLGDLGGVRQWRDSLSGRTFETSSGRLCFDTLPAQSAFVLIPTEA
jgi:cyclomaltodextrinase / maltogenic alpha-amylase / neopullulanase